MRDFFYGHRKYGCKQFNFADAPHIDSWAIEFLRRSRFGGKLFYGEKSLSLKKVDWRLVFRAFFIPL